MIVWWSGVTASNCTPMPTRRSLHATRPSASTTCFEPDTLNGWQPQIERDQVHVRRLTPDQREQLGRGLDGDGHVPRVLQRRAKTVANERRVVGDDDGLRRDRSTGHVGPDASPGTDERI